VTIIPTNGIAIGQRMFLHYMSVQKWGAAGQWDLSEAGWLFRRRRANLGTEFRGALGREDPFRAGRFRQKGRRLYLFGIPGGASAG
jgi:hypothetical protein